MYKMIIRFMPLLIMFFNNIGGLFSGYLKPAIKLSESVKKLIKNDTLTDFTADFIKEYLKEHLSEIHLGLNETIQLLSRGFVDILPASVFEDIDKRKHYDVIAAGLSYLKTLENKMLLSSYLLNLASWIFIELKDENMKITEAHYLTQSAYTYMKVKNLL